MRVVTSIDQPTPHSAKVTGHWSNNPKGYYWVCQDEWEVACLIAYFCSVPLTVRVTPEPPFIYSLLLSAEQVQHLVKNRSVDLAPSQAAWLERIVEEHIT